MLMDRMGEHLVPVDPPLSPPAAACGRTYSSGQTLITANQASCHPLRYSTWSVIQISLNGSRSCTWSSCDLSQTNSRCRRTDFYSGLSVLSRRSISIIDSAWRIKTPLMSSGSPDSLLTLPTAFPHWRDYSLVRSL